MSSEIHNNLKSILKKFESRASYLYKHHYRKYIHTHYNNLIIENLMCNGRCHLVAVFKNYLIEDDNSEYLRRFYKLKESTPRLKKLFLYHDETSVIFPNYTPLIESKYLYNNVIKKQRVIDEQQDLENIRNDMKLNKKNKEYIKREERVFNSTVFGEILTSSESVLRIVFGIENNNIKIENKEKNYKDIDSTYEDYEDIKHLIRELENAEEKININNSNNNTLAGYRLGSNNVLKYKLKLLSNSNNNQIKNKNSNILNNITNNSTNITNSSNNINSTNKLNNQNLNFKDNFLIYNSGKNVNQKLRNSLSITNPNTKNKDKKNFNNNLTIPNHKNSKSSVNRTLYGLNFHSNNANNLINNLINQEKKKNLKNVSISQSNNNSRINLNVNPINNNYIYNNNFPFSSKIADKKNNFINNNINTKYNLNNKSNKILNKIPKLDIHKLDLKNKNNDKIITFTNRNSYRNNHNHILNNPNLFFVETEVLKSERNMMKKRTKKKDILKAMINPGATFSPSNYKSKVIFGRNNNKLIIINEQNLKSMSQNKKNSQYFSNKSINKSSKKVIINDYNFKTYNNNLNKDFFNKYYGRNNNNES